MKNNLINWLISHKNTHYAMCVFVFFVAYIYLRMMFVCPNCGFSLSHPVGCGLFHCGNCNVVSYTSEFNKLLSWAWEIRHGKDIDIIDRDHILSIKNYNLLNTYIQELGYTHQEFYKILKEIEISESIL